MCWGKIYVYSLYAIVSGSIGKSRVKLKKKAYASQVKFTKYDKKDDTCETVKTNETVTDNTNPIRVRNK